MLFVLLILVAIAAPAADFRGVLLDAPCAKAFKVDTRLGKTDLSDISRNRTSEGGGSTTDKSTERRADRAIENSGQTASASGPDLIPCQATITSLQFALRGDDGRTWTLDEPSNAKLVQMIEKDPHWQNALNSISGTPNAAASTTSNKAGANQDVSGSGVVRPAGTARRVLIQGKVEGDTLTADSIRLIQDRK